MNKIVNLKFFNDFDFWKALCLVPCAFLLSSCTSSLTPSQYMSYYEKHSKELSKTIVRGNVKATVAYIPNEYYAARIMQFDSSLSLANALKRYENSLFFVLAVTGVEDKINSVLNDRNGFAGYADNVQRNTFKKEQDMFLINGHDTIMAASAGYDRNWSMGADDAFILGFPKTKLNKKINGYHLILRDITPELGTIDVLINDLVKKTKRLKG